MTKVLVIGLDGATWDIIDPMIKQGKLPTIKRLVKFGCSGNLESTVPPWTIPAWVSMSTGLKPSDLGFSTFMIKDKYNFIPYFFKYNVKNNIWDIVSNFGKKICVSNIPNLIKTYPINGCLIPGWLHTGEFITYPNKLKSNLNNVCNNYIVDIIKHDSIKGEIIEFPIEDLDYIKRSKEVLYKRFISFKYLLSNINSDLNFFVFAEPDRIQHRFFHKRHLIYETYEKIDKYLSELLEIIDDQTIIFIVSDHGFGINKYNLSINDWLIKNGYLTIRKSVTKKCRKFTIPKLLEKIRMKEIVIKNLNLLPISITNKIKKRYESIKFEDLKIDWGNTKAFSYGVFGVIWLNLKSRDEKGIIKDGDYNTIIEEIKNKLKTIEFDGKNLNLEIKTKKQIYVNSSIKDDLPDMVILPTDQGINSFSSSITGDLVTKKNGGNHRLNGIYIVCGPGIRKNEKINLKITDIAPLILHIMDIPIPKKTIGDPNKNIFLEEHHLFKKKITYEDFSNKTKKIIEKIDLFPKLNI